MCFVCYVNSFELFFQFISLHLPLFRFDPFFSFVFSHYRNKTGNWLTHYLSLRTSIEIVILRIGLMIFTFLDRLCSIIQLLWYSKHFDRDTNKKFRLREHLFLQKEKKCSFSFRNLISN